MEVGQWPAEAAYTTRMVWALNATVAACTVAPLLCVLLRWLCDLWSRKNPRGGPQLPPGPAGVPFLGCLETLFKGPNAKKAFAWSSTYGPVVRVKAGLSETIILNDLDSVRAFLSHKDMLDRSPGWVQGASVDVGFSAYGGKKWEVNRRFSLKLLRELGYGKADMQAIIAEGCEQLLNHITEARGQPLDLFQLLLASASNNIGVLLFGYRFPFDHPKHQQLVGSIRDEFMESRKKSLVSLLPSSVAAFTRRLPFTTAAALHKTMESVEAFGADHPNRHLRPTSTIQMRHHPTTSANLLLAENFGRVRFSLTGNAVGFLIPATVTVSAMLMRILLLVAANVETVQKRIQREIDAVVGSERPPTWDDRYATPYTMAVMWEAQRWHTLLPMGLPRWAGQDVAIGKYFVPKGSTIVPNIWAVHNDPKRWSEPEKFDPMRFLNKDGSLALEKLKSVLPFSVGKRSCPGEVFAPLEIYVYVTRMLQKFRIVPQAGSVLDVNIGDDVIMQPGRHMFCCIPREPVSSSTGS
ncbi:cytochrome P450 2C23-like [Amblyomma americanum]